MMHVVFDVQNPSGRERGSSDSDIQDVQVQLFKVYWHLYSVADFSLFPVDANLWKD